MCLFSMQDIWRIDYVNACILSDHKSVYGKGEKMSTFSSLEEAQEYFKGDRFAGMAGAKLDSLSGEEASCSMVLSDIHKNANGGVMGGAIFTLADLAFAVLSNQIHRPTVAQQVSVNYLNMPKGDTLYAQARVKKNGGRTIVINVDVTDSAGREIAQFIGSGFKL